MDLWPRATGATVRWGTWMAALRITVMQNAGSTPPPLKRSRVPRLPRRCSDSMVREE